MLYNTLIGVTDLRNCRCPAGPGHEGRGQVGLAEKEEHVPCLKRAVKAQLQPSATTWGCRANVTASIFPGSALRFRE